MSSKVQTTFILAVGLWVASAFIWPGCITAPLPSSRKPVAFRKSADFAFKQSPPPTRSELVAKLGEPDGYYSDIHVAYYRVNTVTRHNVFLLFFVLPIYFYSEPGNTDVAFIEFDEQDRVKRAGMITERYYEKPEAAARLWFNTPAKP